MNILLMQTEFFEDTHIYQHIIKIQKEKFQSFRAYSRFFPESLKLLGKSQSCSKHPTRVTRVDNAVITTTPRGVQLSPDFSKVLVRGDRLE